MKIAIVAGGFEPDEADQLRRAMATFKRTGTIGNYRQRLVEGMVSKGYPREFAERCFRQIEGFGEYGFPESHAAAFALLVYISCWFKTFYPDVFCAAILNSQPMGFYAPAQLVRDAADHGVEIRSVDVNHSDWDCTLETADFDHGKIVERHAEMHGVIQSKYAVRLGLRRIKGLSKESIETFMKQRGGGYESVRDVWLRSGLDTGQIERLAQADAFRSIGLDRRAALWEVRGLHGRSAAEKLPLFDQPDLRLRDNEPKTNLPIMPLGEHVIHDYRSTSLSLKAHPVAFLRERLQSAGITLNAELPNIPNGARLSVAGLVLVRQRPGKGNAVFLTLEDEGSIANIIVWQRDFERFRSVIMGSKLIRVTGRLQSESGVIHIVAERMNDLSHWLGALAEKTATIGFARAAAVSGPVEDSRDRTRSGAIRPVKLLPRQDMDPVAEAGRVMPKGRNFH